MKPTTGDKPERRRRDAGNGRAGGCGCRGDNLPADYRITIRGHLDVHWSDWLDGVALSCTECGDTVLHAGVRDQAALYGLLFKLRDLGLSLVSVEQVARAGGTGGESTNA